MSDTQTTILKFEDDAGHRELIIPLWAYEEALKTTMAMIKDDGAYYAGYKLRINKNLPTIKND